MQEKRAEVKTQIEREKERERERERDWCDRASSLSVLRGA